MTYAPGPRGVYIETHELPDGRWTWTLHDTDTEAVVLKATKTYATARGALSGADHTKRPWGHAGAWRVYDE